MPRENEPQPTPSFEFTERERLYDKLGHARFLSLLADEHTTIHTAELSENSYGEFLFVTVSRSEAERRIQMTFYGLGFHDHRERWITDVWSWYEGSELSKVREQRLSREAVAQLIAQRQQEITPYLNQSTQSSRGKLYEFLADLTDEDGAISELEDLEDAADWLFGEDE